MALRLNEDFTPDKPEDGDEIRRWAQALAKGPGAQKRKAVARLIELNAEEALLDCLSSADPLVVELATKALWECWLNEEGPQGRREMERGISRMESADLEGALAQFQKLAEKYPRWAEVYNKQATVFYLLGNPRMSIRMATLTVEIKPKHFGAWNGLAICSAQLEKWKEALEAARKALSIQPSAQGNLDLIQLAKAKLAEEG